VAAVAYRILDFFAHVRYQIDHGLFEDHRASWDRYIRDSFASSQVLCASLEQSISGYGGREPGSLWYDYAQDVCERE
jgi:hypothetical protein